MSDKEIKKAFNGRWRFKVESFLSNHKEEEPISYDLLREFCLDFFKTGITIGESRDRVIGVSADANEGAFKKWWDMYDKKIGMGKCLEKWKRLKFEEKQLCLTRVLDYVASTPDKQFRKNPLTYLNQKAWNDEIIIRNNPEQQRNSRYQAAAELIAEYGKQNSGDQK